MATPTFGKDFLESRDNFTKLFDEGLIAIKHAKDRIGSSKGFISEPSRAVNGDHPIEQCDIAKDSNDYEEARDALYLGICEEDPEQSEKMNRVQNYKDDTTNPYQLNSPEKKDCDACTIEITEPVAILDIGGL